MDYQPQNSPNLIKQYIADLDLTSVINRLIYIENWSKEQAILASKQYRNFLFLKWKYGKLHLLPPSTDIDEVWHAHILNTEDYLDFSEKLFGCMLHHQPHHGKNNSISHEKLEEFFNETQRLYHLEFGEYIFTVRKMSLRKKLSAILRKPFIQLKFKFNGDQPLEKIF